MVLAFHRNKKQTPTLKDDNGHSGMKEYQMRLGLLCDIAEEASSITHVSTLLERILKVTQQTVGASITSVFLKDEGRPRIHLPITVSKYEDAARLKATALESEIADLVASSVTPIMSNDVAADPRLNLNGNKPIATIVKSIMAVPILKGQKVIGVLVAADKEIEGGFTPRDFEVLKGFAGTEALILLVSLEKTAIDNVNTLTLNESLLEGYRNTVNELASAIDVKDVQVYAHARRTKEYTLLAANSLSLSPRELQAIEFGALLHDIGKIGIDCEILCKPGPLTDEEWKIIYGHPQKGADILKDIPHLKDAANIVLHHHERYDGTGYPKNLKGEEIPLGARLVMVANAYDTMTTDNPYRAALNIDEAMKELIDGTGTQFCPKAVEAFVAAFKKDRRNIPLQVALEAITTKEVKEPVTSVSEAEKQIKDTRNLVITIKKEAKETEHLKIKSLKAAKEARIKAEKEAREAKIRAEKEAQKEKIKAEEEEKKNRFLQIKAQEEAKRARIIAERAEKKAKAIAEREAKEAKIKAEAEEKKARILKIKAEQQAKRAGIIAAREEKKRVEREAKEAKAKAEREAKEAKIKAEEEEKKGRILKIKAEEEAKRASIIAAREDKEAKVRAEREAKEAKARAEAEEKKAEILKIQAEKEAKKAKIATEIQEKEAKVKAEQEVKLKAVQKLKIKAREDAKKTKEKQPVKANNKIGAEIFKGHVRVILPITVSNEEVKAFGRDLEKIQSGKILMLSHAEDEGHQFLLVLQKPITLIRFIKEIPRVESVGKKGDAISVVLKDGYS